MNTVSFPGLGLQFELNRVAVSIFGLEIYWYGVIIASGFLLAVVLCSRWANRFGIKPDTIIDMLLFAVPITIVGLRAYYVIFYLDLYRRADGSLDWWAIISIRDGGLAIYGGIIAAVITLLVFCKVRKINFLAFADLGVHGLLIGQLIGRWGNFVNVEAYGGITTLPWRMCSASIAEELLYKGLIDQQQVRQILQGTLGVHPTFFYESLWNLVGLVLLYCMGRYARKFDGQIFCSYFIWYGIGRFWIEGLRTDSLYFFGLEFMGIQIRTSQVVALVTAAAALCLFIFMLHRSKGTDKLRVGQVTQDDEAEQDKPDPDLQDKV